MDLQAAVKTDDELALANNSRMDDLYFEEDSRLHERDDDESDAQSWHRHSRLNRVAFAQGTHQWMVMKQQEKTDTSTAAVSKNITRSSQYDKISCDQPKEETRARDIDQGKANTLWQRTFA
jgi:hypothetical protein